MIKENTNILVLRGYTQISIIDKLNKYFIKSIFFLLTFLSKFFKFLPFMYVNVWEYGHTQQI